LSDKELALIFPAFVSEYSDDPFHHLEDLSDYFSRYLHQANSISPGIDQFSFSGRNFLDDELKTQFITYTYSCAVSSFLSHKRIKSAYCAGYSMGIYAALFHSGVIGFSEGLELIVRAFESIKRVTSDTLFSMGTIIGLNHEDLLDIQRKVGTQVEITNQNSLCSFVIAGPESAVREMLEIAREEGALSTRLIPVSDPYHTSYINPPGADHRMIMSGISFKDPAVPLVSLIDRKILRDEQTCRDEVIRNLYTPMSWYRTQLFLQQKGVSVFIEGGTGKTLTKNSKFIEGDALFLSPDSRSFLSDLEKIHA
jgi:[acyl-carrier-protein] S-malonyltransferase